MVTYKIRNNQTGEVLEVAFPDFETSEIYEAMLTFVGADFETCLDEKKP